MGGRLRRECKMKRVLSVMWVWDTTRVPASETNKCRVSCERLESLNQGDDWLCSFFNLHRRHTANKCAHSSLSLGKVCKVHFMIDNKLAGLTKNYYYYCKTIKCFALLLRVMMIIFQRFLLWLCSECDYGSSFYFDSSSILERKKKNKNSRTIINILNTHIQREREREKLKKIFQATRCRPKTSSRSHEKTISYSLKMLLLCLELLLLALLCCVYIYLFKMRKTLKSEKKEENLREARCFQMSNESMEAVSREAAERSSNDSSSRREIEEKFTFDRSGLSVVLPLSVCCTHSISIFSEFQFIKGNWGELCGDSSSPPLSQTWNSCFLASLFLLVCIASWSVKYDDITRRSMIRTRFFVTHIFFFSSPKSLLLYALYIWLFHQHALAFTPTLSSSSSASGGQWVRVNDELSLIADSRLHFTFLTQSFERMYVYMLCNAQFSQWE